MIKFNKEICVVAKVENDLSKINSGVNRAVSEVPVSRSKVGTENGFSSSENAAWRS